MYYTLRIAAAMCFIGHGAFGIITKQVWCNYFAVFGVGHDMAYRLMPVLGTVDILLGIVLLLYPVRAVAGWLVVWGIVTATLRPLSGEPFAEFIERAGNFGAPFVLLLLCGGFPKHIKDWFKRIGPDAIHPGSKTMEQVVLALRVIAFLLMAGHGWLNLLEKQGLIAQYAALGFSNPATAAHIAGIFEIMAAIALLIRPLRPVVFAFLIWKMASELFYPRYELFEWVERGGSYGVLLALWLSLEKQPSRSPAMAV